ncbi:MAG: tricarballylate utilization 4Fe-4S protein TcuB [Pseudomonadota bacterium]
MSVTEASTYISDQPSSAALQETTAVLDARRTMEICNACRYCEGFCPVFPAMERRRAFSVADLGHLANLCHNCKGCWYSCQYAPPHEFGLNLPKRFAEVRTETYVAFAWPSSLGATFERNGLWVAILTGIVLTLIIAGSIAFVAPGAMTAVHQGPGAFYQIMPHNVMVLLGGVTFGWAVLAMIIGGVRYWKACGASNVGLRHIVQAFREAGTTRHLGGAGDGCNDIDERYSLGRRHFHMATLWGFLLSFASTSVATLMHYFLGWEAPYSWYSAPVVLGTVGGVLLCIGTLGLFWLKVQADPEPANRRHFGMDHAFLALLFIVSATGLALLFFRHTSAMGWLLVVHLGFVFALFLTLPYGKFVHGIYRTMAIVRDVAEREDEAKTTA